MAEPDDKDPKETPPSPKKKDRVTAKADRPLPGQDEQNPLMRPTPADKGGADHRFAPIAGLHRKDKTDLGISSSDDVVNVRGPDEKQLSRDTTYVVGLFRYRTVDRAMVGKKKLEEFGAVHVQGPRRQVMTQKGPDGEDQEIEYFSVAARLDVPDDQTPNEYARKLKQLGAKEVEGPHREGGRRRFSLVVQHRSGRTEELLFPSEEEALAKKQELEDAALANPVQGVVPRRVGAGQSSLRDRGLTQAGNFSDQSALKAKHKKYRDTMERDAAIEKIRQETGMGASEAEEYMKSLGPRAPRTSQDLEGMKPDFEGSFEGQRHTTLGPARHWMTRYKDKETGEMRRMRGQSQAKSKYEFIWSQKDRQWYTPTQYSIVRRGGVIPTRQAPAEDPSVADVPKPKAPEGVDLRKPLDPSSEGYRVKYARTAEKLGQNFTRLAPTREFGQAMLRLGKEAVSGKGVSRPALDVLRLSVKRMEELLEAESAAKMPEDERKYIAAAIDLGYRVANTPPPVAPGTPAVQPGEFDEPEAPRKGGLEMDPQTQRRLGVAKKNMFPGFDMKKDKESGRRLHVVPRERGGKLVGHMPSEYQADRSPEWKDFTWLMRGQDDTEYTPPADDAWRALKKKLGKDFTWHQGERPAPQTKEPTAKDDPKAGPEASADTPWRALARLKKTGHEPEVVHRRKQRPAED
jgi:hypothetical protein